MSLFFLRILIYIYVYIRSTSRRWLAGCLTYSLIAIGYSVDRVIRPNPLLLWLHVLGKLVKTRPMNPQSSPLCVFSDACGEGRLMKKNSDGFRGSSALVPYVFLEYKSAV